MSIRSITPTNGIFFLSMRRKELTWVDRSHGVSSLGKIFSLFTLPTKNTRKISFYESEELLDVLRSIMKGKRLIVFL